MASLRFLTSILALGAFLASVTSAVRGNFTYPLELGVLALLGLLLVAFLALPQDDAVTSMVTMLFFLAALANIAYLYSVSGYLSLARLGTLAITISGLVVSGSGFIMQPVPAAALTSQAKKLIAAERKLSDARQKLESISETRPAKSKARRAKKRGKK